MKKGEALTMAKLAAVKVKDGKTEEAMIGFLKALIEKGVVEDIIVPKALPSGEGFVQTLIRDAQMLGGGCALSPTMPVQSARVVSNLTVKNLGKKVAAVMKACEIRAIVELTKFLQVKLDNLYLIGIDCPGTFEVPDYAKMVQEGKGGEKLTKELVQGDGARRGCRARGIFLPGSLSDVRISGAAGRHRFEAVRISDGSGGRN